MVLEAMAAGVPIVTTARGAIPETVRDGVDGFVDDPDPALIADRVLRLLRDPELRARMGSAARQHYLDDFTQERADERLTEWLEQVAAEGHEVKLRMTPRIVHVLWSLSIGGAERAVFQLIAEQRRNGLVADAAIAADAGLYGRFVRETGATVHELHQRRAREVSAILRARTVFGAYDIVHFHSAEPMLIAAAATVPVRRYYTHRAGAFHYPWKQALRYRQQAPSSRRTRSRISQRTPAMPPRRRADSFASPRRTFQRRTTESISSF